MRQCIFCGGAERKLSHEHIWPRWLSKALKKRGVQRYEAVRVVPDPRDSTRRLPRQVWFTNALDLTVRSICEKCNGKDLSELESAAKPCVLPLATTLDARWLGIEDQVVLASWITKIAIEYEFTHGHPRFFTPAERELFIATLEPVAEPWIWLAPYRSARPYTAGAAQRPHITEQGTNIIHVTTGIVGSLAFQLLARRWPEGTDPAIIRGSMASILTRWGASTLQVWPIVHFEGVHWPPSEYLEDESMQPFADRWTADSFTTPR